MNRNGKAGAILAMGAVLGVALSGVARADQVQDATITARIETAYMFNEHLNPFEINTTTQDGTVTLGGTVESQIQKDLAERIAKSVAGVKQVQNNIQVGAQATQAPQQARDSQWTSTVNDESVTASVRTRLEGLKGLDARQVQVQTQGGTVTLSGTVSSNDQRQRAERIARSTRGVGDVVNKIQVSGTGGAQASTQSQPERRGVRVGGVPRTEEPVLETPPQDERATDGGTSRTRETDMPTESREARREDARELREGQEENEELLQNMRRQADRDLNEAERGAEGPLEGARERLSGVAEGARERAGDVAEEARERAGDVAQGARKRAGEAGETVSDEWVEKRIELDLALNRDIRMGDLDVEVENGIATLNGTVDSASQKQLAEKIAEDINGVRQVRNNISVSGDRQS